MIRVGMVAFRPDPDTFYTALEQASLVADEVVVVYGRFKGFDMKYQECPKMPPGVKLIKVDHKHTQEGQRDLYLKGLDANDILFVWDSDLVLMTDPLEVRSYLLSLEDWDSAQVEWLKPDGSYEQSSISIFRYHPGWDNKHGGMLGDHSGTMIASPKYRVVKSKSNIVFFHMRDQGTAYRVNQRMYWDRIHGGK